MGQHYLCLFRVDIYNSTQLSPELLDPYPKVIQFDHLEKNRFYPIPILFTQYKNGADSAVNVG